MQDLLDFIKLALKSGIAIDVVDEYEFKDSLAVDLKVKFLEGDEEIETVYHIDFSPKKGFHLLDFGVDLFLGNTPREALDGLKTVTREGYQAQMLKKKHEEVDEWGIPMSLSKKET